MQVTNTDQFNRLMGEFDTAVEQIRKLPSYKNEVSEKYRTYDQTRFLTTNKDGTRVLIYSATLEKLRDFKVKLLELMLPLSGVAYVISFIVSHPNEATKQKIDRAIEEVKASAEKFKEEFIDCLKHEPTRLLEKPRGGLEVRVKWFPFIGECHCGHLSRFNYSTRDIFTERISEVIKKSRKIGTLTLCSVGSGYCLQELQLHARLKDYRIRWILIDCVYKTYFDSQHKSETLVEFEILAKSIRPDTQVEYFHDDEDYFKLENSRPDVILLIDFPDFISHVKEKYTQVKARGATPTLAILGRDVKEIEIIE